MRSLVKSVGAFVVALSLAILAWSYWPNQVAPFPPDPAVDYANKTFPSEHPYTEGYFKFEGTNIHYVEAGTGPLLILVHGFPAYWYAMIRQMEALKPHFRVIAIDSLGAGRSDAPQDLANYQLAVTAAHISELIVEKSEDQQAYLIGHDWGGAFVFSFAQKYPDQVKKVVGISSPATNVFLDLLKDNQEQKNRSQYVSKLKSANSFLLLLLNAPNKIWQGAYSPLLDMRAITQEESELFKSAFRNPKRINAYLNWYRANIPALDKIENKHYWPAPQARLSMPILVIRGKKDNVFVPEYVDRMRENSTSAQVLEIENAGHWPHVEQAELVNETILNFLQGVLNESAVSR